MKLKTGLYPVDFNVTTISAYLFT